PRRMAGALILLIALVLVIISYASATGWAPSHGTSERSRGTTEAPNVSDPATSSVSTTHVVTQQPRDVENEEEGAPGAPVGAEDGYIPDGEVLSPLDVDHPAIAKLDPDLLDAVQRAAADAEAEGIVMVVTSGWRSPRYQQVLLDEAVLTYGSEEEARKWVNTPDRSSHVTGEAIDIGYEDADFWLIEHGYRYGLCQTYANEIWHFELAVEPGETCPAPLDDATEGSR